MSGILYGVGVGPGDPELMTLKAVRLIRENEVIALPGKEPRATTAYKIAVQAVPELADKTLLPIPMPMVMNRETVELSHKNGADFIETYLKQGRNVVFLTLGDPTIYSTFSYVQKHILERGYETVLVSGIPSFCAAAARANISLAEWNQPLHIIPATHMCKQPYGECTYQTPPQTLQASGAHPSGYSNSTPDSPSVASRSAQSPLNFPGNYVLMKSGSKIAEVKALLRESGRNVIMVENCGLPNEQIYYSAAEIPDTAGYYSLIIAKNGNT